MMKEEKQAIYNLINGVLEKYSKAQDLLKEINDDLVKVKEVVFEA